MVATSEHRGFAAARNNNNAASHLQDVDYTKNVTELFSALEESDWDRAVQICKDFPEQASKWVVRRDSLEKAVVSWRRLPIHEACLRQPNDAVIDALLSAHPVGIREKDHNGRLPLHHACVHGAELSVVDKLLMADPEAANARDMWDKTPASAAVASSFPNKKEIMDALEKGSLYYVKKVVESEWTGKEDNKLKTLEQQLRDEREKSKATIASMEKQATRETKSLRQTISRLEKELNASRSRTTLLEQKTQEKIAGEEYLKRKVNELEVKISRDHVISAALTGSHKKDKQALEAKHNRDKSELENTVKFLESAVKVLSIDKADLEEILRKKDRYISELQASVDDISKEQHKMISSASRQQKSMEAASDFHGRILDAASRKEKEMLAVSAEHERIVTALTNQREVTKALIAKLTSK